MFDSLTDHSTITLITGIVIVLIVAIIVCVIEKTLLVCKVITWPCRTIYEAV